MLRHILLVKFTKQTNEQDLANLEQAFYQLKLDIAGIEAIEFGENNSPEALNKDYSHAIVMSFSDLAARDAYLSNSYHETFKVLFVPMIDDILVFDYTY
ncbi:stress protein [Marinomonas sp. 42_23_T18]|nr:stress protein [Marinomonas sp. 42_23_T18]